MDFQQNQISDVVGVGQCSFHTRLVCVSECVRVFLPADELNVEPNVRSLWFYGYFHFYFFMSIIFSSSPMAMYPVPCAEYNAIGALFVWHSKYSLLSNRIIFSVRCHLHAALRCNVHVCRHCAFMFRQFTHRHMQTHFKKKCRRRLRSTDFWFRRVMRNAIRAIAGHKEL